MNMQLIYEKAARLAKQAIDLDHAKDKTNALTLYMLTCEYMIGAIKYDRNPLSRKVIKQKIAGYLKRAETLKAEIAASPAVQAKAAEAASAAKAQEAARKAAQLPRHFKYADPEECAGWSDVAGVEGAKEVLDEAVIFPQKHPHLFTGKRQPSRGILLYGPPGTGKTLLVKALAKEAGVPVAVLSASDLVSKWQGDTEKAIKELFVNARKTRPCVVFIDEIDSIGGTRNEGEQDSVRRMKTELLRQLDGVGPGNEGVTFIGATNAPWDLDAALRRRFDQLVYMPLPDTTTREKVLHLHLDGPESAVTGTDIKSAAKATKGHSAADLQIVAREALMLPVRRALKSAYFHRVKVTPPGETKARLMWTPCGRWSRGSKKLNMLSLDPDSVYVPPVAGSDLKEAVKATPSSVSPAELKAHAAWTKKFRARDGSVGTGLLMHSKASAPVAAPTRTSATAAAAAAGGGGMASGAVAAAAAAGGGAGGGAGASVGAARQSEASMFDTLKMLFGLVPSAPEPAPAPAPAPAAPPRRKRTRMAALA